MKERIDYLDGLRGVAILLVLGFHAYSRWPEIVPYGDAYQNFPIFKLGWLGVQLFFLISGFVIFMTLDKTETFRLYIYKRWLRLFPAMLLASLLIYTSSCFLDSRPAGTPNILSLISGLTFIQPDWWGKLLGFNVGVLEGAFWSLFVEFKFYVLAGLIYFFVGRKFLAPSLLLLFLCSIFLSYISSVVDIRLVDLLYEVSNSLSLKYFGWFSSGAIFYLFYQNKDNNYFLVAIAVSFLSSYFVGSIYAMIAAIMISLLFAGSLKITLIQRILVNRIFMFFGFISYPLYLIHENAMISMVIQFPGYTPWLNMFLSPLIPIAILSIIAYIVANKYERLVRVKIDSFVRCYVPRYTRHIVATYFR